MEPETGDVFTVVPLDREQTSVYHLTLVAQDSSPTEPQASAVNLTIFVKDVNDNAPRFSSPRYTAYVPGATKSGKRLRNGQWGYKWHLTSCNDSVGAFLCEIATFSQFQVYLNVTQAETNDKFIAP